MRFFRELPAEKRGTVEAVVKCRADFPFDAAGLESALSGARNRGLDPPVLTLVHHLDFSGRMASNFPMAVREGLSPRRKALFQETNGVARKDAQHDASEERVHEGLGVPFRDEEHPCMNLLWRSDDRAGARGSYE